LKFERDVKQNNKSDQIKVGLKKDKKQDYVSKKLIFALDGWMDDENRIYKGKKGYDKEINFR
jgi:hypothetical protein